MRRTMLFTASVIAAVLLMLSAEVASAQIRYSPHGGGSNPAGSLLRQQTTRRPTVSPYLNLLDSAGSFATPYHQFVRPQLDQQRFQREQTAQMGALEQQFRIAEQRRRQEQRQMGIRPTGHSATFMNYLHYYQSPQQGR